MVKLSVPGTLAYRDVVLRVVGSVCRLVGSQAQDEQEADRRGPVEDFDEKVVSAVGEAFNNIVLHAYSGTSRGEARVEIEFDGGSLTVRLFDTGKGFDPSAELEPDLESLPESHMGLYLVRACVDEVDYRRGVGPAPNVLTLTKHYFARGDTAASFGRTE